MVTQLGTLRQITPNEVEGLFAADLAFLQDLYGIINFGSPADVEALQLAATGPVQIAPDPEPAPEPSGSLSIDDSDQSDSSFDDDVDRTSRAATARRRSQIEEVARPSGP